VGLGVVVPLVDVLLEVRDDGAAHGAGGGAALLARVGPEAALLARVGPGAGVAAPVPARAVAAAPVPAALPALVVVPTAAMSAAAPPFLGAAPIVPLSPRHRTSLGWTPADSVTCRRLTAPRRGRRSGGHGRSEDRLSILKDVGPCVQCRFGESTGLPG